MKRLIALVALVLAVGLTLLAQPRPAEEKPNAQDVTFVANVDKTQQKYMMILPDGFKPGQPHHLLIVLHGHGSDRTQCVKPSRGEFKATLDVAAAHKMIYVSPDYRGIASWMGPSAEADVAQIIGDLKKQYRIGKVIVSGGSMGGMACLAFAVRRPELVDAVASMNGMANVFAWDSNAFVPAIARSYGGSKTEVPQEWKNRSAEYWPEKLTMPVGLTAGGKDTAVPADSVLRLAKALEKQKSPVLLVYRENGGHSTNYDDAKAILEFVIDKATGVPTTASAPSAATKPR